MKPNAMLQMALALSLQTPASYTHPQANQPPALRCGAQQGEGGTEACESGSKA